MNLFENEYIAIECPASVERAWTLAQKAGQRLVVVTPYRFFENLGNNVTVIKPCPCGWFSHPNKHCTCSVRRVEAYQRKCCNVWNGLWVDGILAWRHIKLKNLNDICVRLLRQVFIEFGLVDELPMIIQVARAAADLSGHKDIAPEHIAEGIAYRGKF